MRWEALQLDQVPGAAPALFGADAVARTFDTPGFRGMTFYEVHAKSIINRVPASSRMAFSWTINPYRGCGHACVYCFARNTHTYLDLDAGRDFDSKVVVKVNAPELVRRELAAPRWSGDHVAMGTNVDCYQRAEGRYRLMPGIIGALRDAAQPVLDPDQGHADPARPRPAGGGRGGHRRRPERVRGLHRRGAVGPDRAGHAEPAAAAGHLHGAGRPRPAVRRADGADPAVPVRLPRAARGRRRGGGRGRGGQRDPHRAAPAAGHARVVRALAGPPPPGARRPVPRPVRRRGLRPPPLPGADRRAGP